MFRDAAEYREWINPAYQSMHNSGGVMRQSLVIVMPEDAARPERRGSFLEVSFDSSGTMLYAWGHRDIYGVLFVYELKERGGPADLIFEGRYRVGRPIPTYLGKPRIVDNDTGRL